MKFKIAAQLFAFCLFGYGTLREPMKVNFENGALYRWLNKKVIATRVLDDMENLDHWKGYTIGPDAIVDARVSVKTTDVANVSDISLTTEKVHNGSKALLMRTPVRLEGRAKEWPQLGRAPASGDILTAKTGRLQTGFPCGSSRICQDSIPQRWSVVFIMLV